MSENVEQGIRDQILSHLLDHPDAQDTLEGIVEWWLLERRIRTGIADVHRALEELVRTGWLRQNVGRDKKVHYRLRRSPD